ncbi:hypothetical protein BLOT_016278 [Blomia tropicalis]|nr:hypothetical protein BLOT_016278 [Blomia tropicalis]
MPLLEMRTEMLEIYERKEIEIWLLLLPVLVLVRSISYEYEYDTNVKCILRVSSIHTLRTNENGSASGVIIDALSTNSNQFKTKALEIEVVIVIDVEG